MLWSPLHMHVLQYKVTAAHCRFVCGWKCGLITDLHVHVVHSRFVSLTVLYMYIDYSVLRTQRTWFAIAPFRQQHVASFLYIVSYCIDLLVYSSLSLRSAVQRSTTPFYCDENRGFEKGSTSLKTTVAVRRGVTMSARSEIRRFVKAKHRKSVFIRSSCCLSFMRSLTDWLPANFFYVLYAQLHTTSFISKWTRPSV